MNHRAVPRTVADPALRPAEQQMVRAAGAAADVAARTAKGFGTVPDRIVVAYVLIASAVVAVQILLGSAWAWAWFAAGVVSASAAAAAVIRGAARHYRGRYVHPAVLDRDSRVLLARAQAAADAVRGARLYRDGILDVPAVSAVLAEREWELALRLSELSGAEARLTAAEDARAGFRQAASAAVRRVEDLEAYADKVRAADSDYRSGDDGAASSALLTSLLVGTAADGQASAELSALACDAAAAAECFRGGGTGPPGPP